MFKILYQIILIIYIIFLFFNVLDLKKYNINGLIINCKDKEDILLNIRNLNISLINHKNIYDIQEVMFDKGESIENIVINERDFIYINKNKSLLKEINEDEIPNFFTESKIPMVNNSSISIYKNHTSNLQQCYSNHTVLYIIDGMTKIYIFNPKHNDEIKGKGLNIIKKWGHIKELKKGDYLIIPTNWFYTLETKEHCIIYNNSVNNIFTIIPNFIRENYSSFKLSELKIIS